MRGGEVCVFFAFGGERVLVADWTVGAANRSAWEVELAAGVGSDVLVVGRTMLGSLAVGMPAANELTDRAVASAPLAYCLVVGRDPYGFVVSVELFVELLGVTEEAVGALFWYQSSEFGWLDCRG